MDPDKDYYCVLGVSPEAEDIVIKAAYRALAQRYHPDRLGPSQGPSPGASHDTAHLRMSGLNEAYAVLSDRERRSAYDQMRGEKGHSGGSRFSDTEEKAPPGEDPLEKDWRIALKYYPDLAVHEQRLAHFSWKLANTYRAYLLETRQFEPRGSLAALMETHFLSAYFGDNGKNVDFARRLIIAGQRKAALALNDAVRVLGANADPARVIANIAREFDIRHLAVDKEKLCALLAKLRAASAPTSLFTQMVSELGGIFSGDGDPRDVARSVGNNRCALEFDGRQWTFPSETEFRSWFRRDVMPIAEQLAR